MFRKKIMALSISLLSISSVSHANEPLDKEFIQERMIALFNINTGKEVNNKFDAWEQDINHFSLSTCASFYDIKLLDVPLNNKVISFQSINNKDVYCGNLIEKGFDKIKCEDTYMFPDELVDRRNYSYIPKNYVLLKNHTKQNIRLSTNCNFDDKRINRQVFIDSLTIDDLQPYEQTFNFMGRAPESYLTVSYPYKNDNIPNYDGEKPYEKVFPILIIK